MCSHDQTSSLLALPWELRSIICLEVLKHRRTKQPIFDRKLVENRVRLRNCFDRSFPEDTNIYIRKPRCRYIHGRGLLETCQRLRRDVMLLINEQLKTGRIEIPFVLDVMFVKDVGIFPTWMSFPYRTKRILNLRLNVRIIRPKPDLIPLEWVEMGRHRRDDWSKIHTEPTQWNLLTVVSLYALGRLSFRPRSAEMPLEAGKGHGTTPIANKTQGKRGMKGNIVNHKSPVVDAHLVPFESTPYVVDDLQLDFHQLEYDAVGKVIMPTKEDDARKQKLGEFWFMSSDAISPRLTDRAEASQFYKDGYIQFGRNVFIDSSMMYQDSMSDLEINASLAASGVLASYLLRGHFMNGFDPISFSDYGCTFALYFEVLANTVGAVALSSTKGNIHTILYKNTELWVRSWNWDHLDPHKGRIKRQIAEEEAKENPDPERLAQMRTACRRIALGWQAQHDKWYKETYG